MKELTNDIRTSYQIMRNAESHHCIKDGLSMTIKTFVRVYPYGDEKAHMNISFQSTGYEKPITSGEVFEILKEKYFKPEMVRW